MKLRTTPLVPSLLLVPLVWGCHRADDTIASSAPPEDGPDTLEVLWLSPEVYSGLQQVGESTVRLMLGINSPLTVGGQIDEEMVFDWSVSYKLESAAAGLGPHEFVLAGLARNGDLVLEYFDLEMPDGSQIVQDTTSVPPSITIAGGGSYLPPSQRAAANPPVRDELYRGSALGADVAIANDPQRRFTYVCSRDLQKLFVVPWDSNAAVQEYPMESDPTLLGLVESMTVQEHVTEGPKLKLELDTSTTPFRYLILSDYDDDGLFDGDVPFTRPQYASNGYPQLWSTDYVSNTPILGPS